MGEKTLKLRLVAPELELLLTGMIGLFFNPDDFRKEVAVFAEHPDGNTYDFKIVSVTKLECSKESNNDSHIVYRGIAKGTDLELKTGLGNTEFEFEIDFETDDISDPLQHPMITITWC